MHDKKWRRANRKYRAYDARKWQRFYWEQRRKLRGKVEAALRSSSERVMAQAKWRFLRTRTTAAAKDAATIT
jgi:hypothetical protein